MHRSRTNSYRFLIGFARMLMHLFFREIAVEGTENIPVTRGGLVVSWHPNGLIDPALILATFPGHIVFGARHGLFDWPLFGYLMRSVGTVPIYRAADVSDLSREERMEANEESLDSLARELTVGSWAALFPEGVSHDQPNLAEIKTGAARLYYRARGIAAEKYDIEDDECGFDDGKRSESDCVDPRPDVLRIPVIVPVGLHYDRKNIFRSRVLVSYHTPVLLPPTLDVTPRRNDDRTDVRTRNRELTTRIRNELVEVARVTEDWQLHHLMHRAGRLMRAERAARAGTQPRPSGIAERELAYSRIWYGYRERSVTHPADVQKLRRMLSYYDRSLSGLGISDSELDSNPRLTSVEMFVLLFAQLISVYLLLPPVLIFGYVVNAVPYLILKPISKRLSKARKDYATVKLIVGMILFPLTWLTAALLAASAYTRLNILFPALPNVPVTVGVATVILSIVGGFLALRYVELAQETARAVRVRITRHQRQSTIEKLRTLRRTLYEEFLRLGEGLELPGRIAPDGRILPGSVLPDSASPVKPTEQ